MGLSLTQATPAAHRITAEDRVERIGQLTTRQRAVCGGDIGVFLKFGLDWRHYRGTDLTDLELFEPGHRPVLAWRSPGLPAQPTPTA